MLPEEVLTAFAQRDPIAVLTTVDEAGMPNSVYVSCYGLVDGRIHICDSAFTKTLHNLHANPERASFLFWARDIAAYQLKGSISYYTEGPAFESGSTFAKPGMSLKGVAVFEPLAIFKGATRLSGL